MAGPVPVWAPVQKADRAGRSALSPGLIAVLAAMVEAALETEDALADRGNMPDRRDPTPREPVAIADAKRRAAKEARS